MEAKAKNEKDAKLTDLISALDENKNVEVIIVDNHNLPKLVAVATNRIRHGNEWNNDLIDEHLWDSDYWSKRQIGRNFLKENSRFSRSEFWKIPCLAPILSWWVTVLQKNHLKKVNYKI